MNLSFDSSIRIRLSERYASMFGAFFASVASRCIGSMPLNPTIANVFNRRGTMESWGRGISLIMQSCREQCLLEPKIEIVPNFVNLTIWFNELLSAQDSTRQHKTAQVKFDRDRKENCRLLSNSENHGRHSGNAWS